MDLMGANVVVTGTFSRPRAEIEAQLTALGARIMSSVSNNTNVVFAGADAGAKLKKAGQLGIKVLGADELDAVLASARPASAPSPEKPKARKTPVAHAALEGPLGDWLPRFNHAVDELMKHPDVIILNRAVAPGVSDDELAKVEKHLGAKLSPAIKNLYRQANGLSLRWVSKASLAPREISEGSLEFHRGLREYPSDNGHESGCICLLPLRKVFMPRYQSWHDIFVFDFQKENTSTWRGKSYNSWDLAMATRVFDYKNFFRMTALVTIESPGDPSLAMGDDHGASWDEMSLTFEQYFEVRLANYFATWSSGDLPRQPTLEQVLAAVRHA